MHQTYCLLLMYTTLNRFSIVCSSSFLPKKKVTHLRLFAHFAHLFHPCLAPLFLLHSLYLCSLLSHILSRQLDKIITCCSGSYFNLHVLLGKKINKVFYNAYNDSGQLSHNNTQMQCTWSSLLTIAMTLMRGSDSFSNVCIENCCLPENIRRVRVISCVFIICSFRFLCFFCTSSVLLLCSFYVSNYIMQKYLAFLSRMKNENWAKKLNWTNYKNPNISRVFMFSMHFAQAMRKLAQWKQFVCSFFPVEYCLPSSLPCAHFEKKRQTEKCNTARKIDKSLIYIYYKHS